MQPLFVSEYLVAVVHQLKELHAAAALGAFLSVCLSVWSLLDSAKTEKHRHIPRRHSCPSRRAAATAAVAAHAIQ